VLALHLLQSARCTSTPSSFNASSEPRWADRLADDYRCGLTPLFWSNINPYSTFRLGVDRRLDLDRGPTAPSPRSVDPQPGRLGILGFSR
jgi:hypothetical protein